MARTPQKSISEMTDAEMHERLGVLRRKVAWNDKYVVPLTIGMSVLGAALAAAVGLGLLALPLAPMTIVGIFGAVAPTYMGIASTSRDQYKREVQSLSSENEGRIYFAERKRERAQAEAQAAERREVAASRLRLREEFEAALKAMSNGEGTDREMTVGKPLRLKSRSMFGSLLS